MAAMRDMDHSYEIRNLPAICKGAAFSSLEDFQNALAQHMRLTNTVYNISKSQLIQKTQLEGVSSRGYKTNYAPLSPKLKYTYALYGCKHYGVVRSKSRGIRPNQKTFKTDCPSHISIQTDRKRGVLVVKTVILEHNHHLGPDMAQLYPENRRLTGAGGVTRLVHVSKLPPDSKNLRETLLASPLAQPSGGERTLTFRTPPCKVAKPMKKEVDPSNVSLESTSDDNDEVIMSSRHVSSPLILTQEDWNAELEEYLEVLKEEYGCSLEVYRQEGEFKGLMVQDKSMVQAFSAFPECLCVEVIGSMLQVPVFVVLLTVESSAGSSDVAALGVLPSEDEVTVGWLLATFKLKNEASARTRLVFNNGPSEYGDVLKQHFPDCRLLLNPTLCFKSWKRDIPKGVTGVTKDGEDLGIHLLNRAINSTSLAEYEEVYSEMKSALPPEVLTYYNEYWHATHEQWTISHAFKPYLMASTVKLSEHYKRKLSLRSGVNISTAVFFQRFFAELYHQRKEHDNNSLKSVHKMPCPTSTELSHYSTHLTPYALAFVVAQFELIDRCKPFDFIDNSGKTQGAISVPISSCLCPFYVALSLPCCHIFVRRRFLGLDMFDANLYDQRWTKKYYLTVMSERRPVETESSARLTTFQKLRQASNITSELGILLSQSSNEVFTKRIRLLRHLLQAWQNGQDISLVNSEEDSNPIVMEVEQQGVFKLFGMDVNRYVEKKGCGEGGENVVFVADEVEVVIGQQGSSDCEDRSSDSRKS